jgi:outer membrane protein assembly factor BamD (BamD/ComL family)
MRLALLAALLLAACSGPPLGEPSTALARLKDMEADGDLKGVSGLGERITKSTDVSSADRAEAAFMAGEAEHARGREGAAFDRYRWVLENAPWSEHAAVIESRLFEIGKTMLFGSSYSGWFDDRARGVEVLETLAVHFRASDHADDALKMVGDYFSGEDVAAWGEASLAYLRVADEYPDSEWAERCLWLAGHCRLRESEGAVYDRNEALLARQLLERSISTHPHGVAVREAKADLAECRERLAQCELIVADFYAGRGVTSGEQLRLANAAILYPDTETGKAAAARLSAAGLDLATLARDPSRNSIDAVKYRPPRWEREAADKKKDQALPSGIVH